MLRDVICASLSGEEDLEVILQDEEEGELVDLVRNTRSDAVVLSARDGEAPEAAGRLLTEHPGLKLFAITPNGRDGFRVELRPQTFALRELSPQSLVDEIRDAVNRDRREAGGTAR